MTTPPRFCSLARHRVQGALPRRCGRRVRALGRPQFFLKPGELLRGDLLLRIHDLVYAPHLLNLRAWLANLLEYIKGRERWCSVCLGVVWMSGTVLT